MEESHWGFNRRFGFIFCREVYAERENERTSRLLVQMVLSYITNQNQKVVALWMPINYSYWTAELNMLLVGTTDITRTVHFGKPTARERECFTRVLQGHIALDLSVFPENTPGFVLDAFARSFLWKVGLDYRHGTGHGAWLLATSLAIMRTIPLEFGLRISFT
ncbi:hypothetical protein K1719_032746 [Acacia pycnantha]|nr:hypothetical protein K1719_032746 [Acacia pycnantha]